MRAHTIFGTYILLSILALPGTFVVAQQKTPRIENAIAPEKNLLAPLSVPASNTQERSALAPQTASLGPNLISNPSVETAGSSSLPAQWQKGGYGSSTRTLTYPVTGTGGAATKAIRVSVANYTTGDAKWFFNEIPINAEARYQFSNFSLSNVPSIITMRFTLSNGSAVYKDIVTVPASATFQKNTVTFVPPPNAVSLTVYHLLKQNGTLTTDDYSLNEVSSASDPDNLVANGDFETPGANGLPQHWIKGGYGSSTRTFMYPAPGADGSGAKVTLSGYTSGDAKWAFDPVAVTSGTYTYSDIYQSSVPSILTVQLINADGSQSYLNLRTLSAAPGWTPVSVEFVVPSGVSKVTVFHLIKGNGALSIDSVSLKKKSSTGGTGIFSTGAVSLRFDDGLESQYSNALPKLTSSGLKGTFYIVSKQTTNNGFAGVMSIANIQDLYARGHEIGAHTRNHPDLATLSTQQQQDEIQGSRQDILAWNVGPVSAFSYPYGSYTATTMQIVKDAGYSSAAATLSGYATPTSDPYQLERQSVNNDTTLAQVKQWVDTAATNHQWLILTFHGIDLSGTTYSTTPTTFNQIIDYVKQKGIPVVTVSQGTQSL